MSNLQGIQKQKSHFMKQIGRVCITPQDRSQVAFTKTRTQKQGHWCTSHSHTAGRHTARCSLVNGFTIRALQPPQAAHLRQSKCTVVHGAGWLLTSQQHHCPVEVQLQLCWGSSHQETWTGHLLGGLAVWAVGERPAAGTQA